MLRPGLLAACIIAAPNLLLAQLGVDVNVQDWLLRRTARDSAYMAQHVPGYLREESYRLHLRLFSTDRNSTFILQPNALPYDKIVYRPNQPPTMGIQAHYGRLGLGIGFQNPFIDRNTAEKGDTRTTSLFVQLFLTRGLLDAYYHRTSGFYVNNPDDVYGRGGWDGRIYPQRPDLRSTQAGLNWMINFGWRRFSYRAVLNQTETQLRSAGGWLLMPNISWVRVRADSSFLPQADLLGPDPVRGHEYIALGLSGGYGQTFVWRKWYVHASGLVGFAASWQQLQKADDGYETEYRGFPRATFRFAGGYNARRWFAVFTASGEAFTIRYPRLDYSGALSSNTVSVGHRIGK